METNLQQKPDEGTRLPAGIIEGTEAFWHQGEKWLIHNGVTTRFDDAPVKIRKMVIGAFLNDTHSRDILRKSGITKMSEAFEKWYRCVVGALDSTPDFNFSNKQTIPDSYNNTCAENCPLRGKLCSVSTGLKNYEVQTILVLKRGLTFEKSAEQLCVSLPGLKSRIEKIKNKLGAQNMASLIACASYLGI